jgi:hypothetical protein
MWTVVSVAAALALVIHLDAARAQQMVKPGPELQALDPLIGSWNCKVKFWMDPTQPPSESEGIMTRKWIMNGLFLQEDFEGKFAGSDFRGMGITGYDPPRKVYTSMWVDVMTPVITKMEGTFDAKTKTFSMTSQDEIDPTTGKKVKGRDTLRIVSADHQVQEMYRTPEGGKEVKAMEIHYHRIKK